MRDQAGPGLKRIGEGFEELERIEKEVAKNAEREFEEKAKDTMNDIGEETGVLANDVASAVKTAIVSAEA